MVANFPFPVVFIVIAWCLLGVTYLYARWRKRPKAIYVIPRVFVLCSPRTVQFHYEIILRVGLPSIDFNPDKHDIDITVLGQHRNEVVPMTRLNTRTLVDEPLITSLSIIVYRLVELPQLGSLILKHSGPLRAWLYVYDFTVINLATNKEQYFTINKYLGSLNRNLQLDEHSESSGVHYPIDDVPMPSWSLEDMFLVILTVMNSIMLSLCLLPISCGNPIVSDIGSITIASLNGGAVVFFLEWLLYYYARWSTERREYFNLPMNFCINPESAIRLSLAITAITIGAMAIYFGLNITGWDRSVVWILVTTCTCIIVIGTWNVTRLAELSECISLLGLKLKGIETMSIGMKYSEIISDAMTKSGSESNEGAGSNVDHESGPSSETAKMLRSFGPRSSVKSFGFDPGSGTGLLVSRQQANKKGNN